MLLNINNAKIAGNLTRDPETVQLPGDKTLTKFTLAVNDAVNRDAEPTYVDFVAFGQTGTLIESLTEKGNNLYVEGRLSIRNYTDKDGNKRKSTEIVVGSFQALTRKAKATAEAAA